MVIHQQKLTIANESDLDLPHCFLINSRWQSLCDNWLNICQHVNSAVIAFHIHWLAREDCIFCLSFSFSCFLLDFGLASFRWHVGSMFNQAHCTCESSAVKKRHNITWSFFKLNTLLDTMYSSYYNMIKTYILSPIFNLCFGRQILDNVHAWANCKGDIKIL